MKANPIQWVLMQCPRNALCFFLAKLALDRQLPRHEPITARLFKHAVPGAALELTRGGVDPRFSRHCKTAYDVVRGTINLNKIIHG